MGLPRLTETFFVGCLGGFGFAHSLQDFCNCGTGKRAGAQPAVTEVRRPPVLIAVDISSPEPKSTENDSADLDK